MLKPTSLAEQVISELAAALEIPNARYESAERSYKSISEWLNRPDSRFARIKSEVYTQGSFRLGTAVRPIDEDEHYDLDVVCEFALDKASVTQEQLHSALGKELELYAKAKVMDSPTPWHRCWTLNYADSAQFHMDMLPCVPDGQRQRQLRAIAHFSEAFVEKSVAITDKNHPNFRRISDEWPISNPNGYAEWFYDRMRAIFEERRRSIMMKEKKASVAEIPEFRVKTPLQSAIQILKRHRDMQFSENPDQRPKSIIITTLSAQAYKQEASIVGALVSILATMDSFVENRSGRFWIPNPSDPRENFADGWNQTPKQREVFDDWLETARKDFYSAAQLEDLEELVQTLAPRIGRKILEGALAKDSRLGSKVSALAIKGETQAALQRILDAPHRKPLRWRQNLIGQVEISSATIKRDGFRTINFASGQPLPAGCALRFDAKTNLSQPFKVFWQIVNTGKAATAAKNLRGGFEEVSLEEGNLTKKERTQYQGSHSIECFIVKGDVCVARSRPFVVQIA